MYEGYTTAEKHGIVDHISLYALGYFWNINEDFKKATNYFSRSLKLDSNYAPTHYNLAYLYSEKDSLEAALYHAWKAYNLYTYLNYKNDAGQMAGSILGKLNRHSEAISLLLDCDKLIPNTYYTYYYLLNSFLAKKRIVESQVTAHNMFNLDWKSHTINTDIIKMFIQNDQLLALEQFYNDRLEEEKFDKEYRGYVYLHLAQAFHMKNKTEEVLINIGLAQENFNICYDPGHPVFQVIEKMKR
jgi:tetratricopeptide (TPR) repeat protein